MTLGENISLQNYVDDANRKFQESESKLSQIEGSFQARMNGKTTVDLVGALIGTACWLIAFCALYWFVGGYIDQTLGLVSLGLSLVLIAVLFIDEIISFSYYGKIGSYKNSITQLKNRVDVGQASIKSKLDVFMKSRTNGWCHPIPKGNSIPEEAAFIENTINGMETLKNGFLQGLKNVLFFAFVIVVTGICNWSLVRVASQIVGNLSGTPEGVEGLRTVCMIGVPIVEVGMIILAKMWWSHTNCSVTNTTLLVTLLGPVLYLGLAILVTLIIMLASFVIGVVVAIAGAALAIAVVCGSLSGG